MFTTLEEPNQSCPEIDYLGWWTAMTRASGVPGVPGVPVVLSLCCDVVVL